MDMTRVSTGAAALVHPRVSRLSLNTQNCLWPEFYSRAGLTCCEGRRVSVSWHAAGLLASCRLLWKSGETGSVGCSPKSVIESQRFGLERTFKVPPPARCRDIFR